MPGYLMGKPEKGGSIGGSKEGSIIGEYEKANECLPSEMSKTASVCQSWRAPAMGSFKVNADAACFKDGMFGLGGVMRDRKGDVMAATCITTRGCGNSEIAEALAVRHALQIAIEAGLTRVELETDNIKVYHYLHPQRKECSSLGFIINDTSSVSQ